MPPRSIRQTNARSTSWCRRWPMTATRPRSNSSSRILTQSLRDRPVTMYGEMRLADVRGDFAQAAAFGEPSHRRWRGCRKRGEKFQPAGDRLRECRRPRGRPRRLRSVAADCAARAGGADEPRLHGTALRPSIRGGQAFFRGVVSLPDAEARARRPRGGARPAGRRETGRGYAKSDQVTIRA